MQTVEVIQQSHQPVASLFAVLSDHNQLGRILGAPVRRIHDGQEEPNGVGSVRRVGPPGPLGLEETVTAFETNRLIEYRITKGGFPIRNHRGRVEFSDSSDGSQVRWSIEFDAALPLAGPLLRKVLTLAIRRGLKRAA